MNIVRLSPVATAAALAALFAALASHAALYKSVGSDGQIMFSDVPPVGAIAVLRIQGSEDEKAPVSETPIPRQGTLADDLDDAVAHANARVDAAEHALALARKAIQPLHDPLALSAIRLSRADFAQVDFYKRDVLAARRDLLATLKKRKERVQ